ncbi:MAG: tetratricopeptide repeat protein [Deltaproteobacteria bacterium]|jgi:tetratricopeptide (TPR) repeat protein|nr:tetratricopeptide repeat protein [Deltaproteobacteria bacterium]
MHEQIAASELAYLSGRTLEALSTLQAVICDEPDNARALLSLGVIHHALGQYEDAKSSFGKVLLIEKDNKEATKYMALTLISQKDYLTARKFLEDYLAKNQHDYQALNLMSSLEAFLDNFASSVSYARRSLLLEPGQRKRSEKSRSIEPGKIMFWDLYHRHTENEKRDVAMFLTGTENTEVDLLSDWLGDYFNIESVMSFKYDVYQKAASLNDIVWLEGLSNNMVYFLNDRESLKGKLIILRLSREDILSGAAKKLSFQDASLIIFESYYLRDQFLKDNPVLKSDVALEVFLKAYDIKNYEYSSRSGNTLIASVIPNNYEMAEFILLLEAFLMINKKYPETELHLMSGIKTPENEFHVNQFIMENGIGYKVFFHGHGQELKTFLAKNHYFLSAETFSGGPGSVEALMLGLKPLIHASPGAIELYPESCLWKNLSEVVHLYENPPDGARVSQCLREIHKPATIVSQYIQKFITMKWC